MRIELHFGDITEYNADCIVNAARPTLLGGGGVDGAIHKAAGPELKEFCKNLGGCEVGEAKLTPGFNIKAKFIIHTVGPRVSPFNNKFDHGLLEKCYFNSLMIASEQKFEILVFSNISTGAYGIPNDLAAHYSINTIKSFLQLNNYPKKVVICCFELENLLSYTKIIEPTHT